MVTVMEHIMKGDDNIMTTTPVIMIEIGGLELSIRLLLLRMEEEAHLK